MKLKYKLLQHEFILLKAPKLYLYVNENCGYNNTLQYNKHACLLNFVQF
jgi:hypothetical protein